MKLTPRDRMLLVGISLVLVAFGFYHFALSPARQRAAGLEPKVAAARVQLVQAQGKYAAGRSAAGALRTTAPSFTAAERAVPEQADIPGLLRILAHSARASHVRLESISLSGSSTSGATSDSTSPTSDGGANEVPVTLTFDGGYQALNRLVTVSGNRVHAAGPLVGISSVSLSGGSASAVGGGSGSSLTVDITAVVYQRAAATATSAVSTTEGSS